MRTCRFRPSSSKGQRFQNDRGEFIVALLDFDPAILRRQPLPPSQAIECAFTYANTHLLPLLTRIWPVPDDLAHAAGMGDLARVKQWFDSAGVVAGRSRRSVSLQRPATRAATSSGIRPRRSRCSTTRSPLPSSTVTSTWRTSCSSTAQTSTPTGTPTSRRASCTIWSSMPDLRVDAIPHRPRHRHDHQGLPLEQSLHRVGRSTARRTRRWLSGWRMRNGVASAPPLGGIPPRRCRCRRGSPPGR